jgi:hypothetical protein
MVSVLNPAEGLVPTGAAGGLVVETGAGFTTFIGAGGSNFGLVGVLVMVGLLSVELRMVWSGVSPAAK